MISNQRTVGKIESLQGLRVFAFLMIYLLHTGLSDTGEIGVSIFFVLSGFVMYLRYRNTDLTTSVKDLFKFSTGKIKKLYLLHIITMLAFLYFEIKILVEGFSLNKLIETIWHVILNLVLLQVWSPNQATYFSLNGVCWFLCVCLFLYLLFPLINKGIKGYKSVKSAYASIAVTVLLMALAAMVVAKINVPESISNNFTKWFTYIFPVYRLGDFIIGCNLSYIFTNKEHKLSVPTASLLEAAAFGLFLLLFMLRRYGVFVFGSYFLRYNLVYLPASMAVVYILAHEKGLISRLLRLKPLVIVGDLSSYAFLIHTVVIKYYFDILAGFSLALNPVVSTLIILVITITLSYLYSIVAKKRIKK